MRVLLVLVLAGCTVRADHRPVEAVASARLLCATRPSVPRPALPTLSAAGELDLDLEHDDDDDAELAVGDPDGVLDDDEDLVHVSVEHILDVEDRCPELDEMDNSDVDEDGCPEPDPEAGAT
jgi:hypothetical protein